MSANPEKRRSQPCGVEESAWESTNLDVGTPDTEGVSSHLRPRRTGPIFAPAGTRRFISRFDIHLTKLSTD